MSSGLIPSQQTRPNTTDAYYLRKGEPIVSPTVVSTIDIVSADGTKNAVIAQNNNGNMVIYGDASGVLSLGNNSGIITIQNTLGDYNNSLLSAGGQLQVIGDSQAALKSDASGFIIAVSSDCFVNKGGANGIIYDTEYNKPFTYTTLQAPTTGTIAFNQTITPVAGKYQLQLSVESPVAGSASLQMFATDLPSTQVINFSGAEIVPASSGTSLLTLNSGYFNYDGAGGLKIEITTTGSAWTGAYEFQLVKLG